MFLPDWMATAVDNPGEWLSKLAGVVGAFVSLRFLPGGSFGSRFAMFLIGVAFSYYVTPYAAERLSIPRDPAAFMFGVLGMAILSRIWEALQNVSVASILESTVGRWFPKPPTKP